MAHNNVKVEGADVVVYNVETWRKASTGETLQRCQCYTHLAYSKHPGERAYVDNNGWYPVEEVYPHARWCPNRAT